MSDALLRIGGGEKSFCLPSYLKVLKKGKENT